MVKLTCFFVQLIALVECVANAENLYQNNISAYIVHYYNDQEGGRKTISITCPSFVEVTSESKYSTPYSREIEISKLKGDSLCGCLAQRAPARTRDTIKCEPKGLPLHSHLGEISLNTNYLTASGYLLIEECPVYSPADSAIINCISEIERETAR